MVSNHLDGRMYRNSQRSCIIHVMHVGTDLYITSMISVWLITGKYVKDQSVSLNTIYLCMLGNGPFTALSATNHGTILQELCRTDKDFISVSEEVIPFHNFTFTVFMK